MIVTIRPGTDPAQVSRELVARGLWVRRCDDSESVHFVVEAHSREVPPEALRGLPGVLSVSAPASPHPRLDARSGAVEVGDVTIGPGHRPVLLAGPCAVESESQLDRIAAEVRALGATFLRGGAFKPRTSPHAFQGHGARALEWLRRAADAHGLKVVTEVTSELEATRVAGYADLLQIGARNMQNFELLRAVGRTGRPVLLKRGLAATVQEWLLAAEHLLVAGASGVVFCERGIRSFEPSTRFTLDLAAVALLAQVKKLAVVVDPSHATGRRDLVVPLARAGLAAGACGLLVEVHVDPGRALSDGPQALRPEELAALRPTFATASPKRTPRPLRPTSRLPRFYEKSVSERLGTLLDSGAVSTEHAAQLASGGLDVSVADRMSENVISVHGLPLSVALNFVVNGRDVLVPMAVEEPSVVAAASNAARIVRESGGFTGEASAPVMTTQVQLDGVPRPQEAADRIQAMRSEILRLGDLAVGNLVRRGGGCRDVDVRVLDESEGVVVVHVYVDVGEAMGANLVDAVAEAVAPLIHRELGGRLGLRILSNLPLRRTVKVRAFASDEALGGAELAEAIARASRFAELDPFRAVTHNKGVMNGIDAIAVALGQDWRAIEAGAHAYAALDGTYRPIARWKRMEGGLEGHIEIPLAAATVGGSTRVHPGVRAAFALLQPHDARELATVMAAGGLASNLAALRALAGEGIQRGHMKLHARKLEHASEVA